MNFSQVSCQFFQKRLLYAHVFFIFVNYVLRVSLQVSYQLFQKRVSTLEKKETTFSAIPLQLSQGSSWNLFRSNLYSKIVRTIPFIFFKLLLLEPRRLTRRSSCHVSHRKSLSALVNRVTSNVGPRACHSFIGQKSLFLLPL